MIHRGQIGGRKWELAACPVPAVGSGSAGPGVRRGPDSGGQSIPAERPCIAPGGAPREGTRRAEAESRRIFACVSLELPVSGGSGPAAVGEIIWGSASLPGGAAG